LPISAAVECSGVAAHCAIANSQERGGYTTGVVDTTAKAVGRVAADRAVVDRHARCATGVEYRGVNAAAIVSRRVAADRAVAHRKRRVGETISSGEADPATTSGTIASSGVAADHAIAQRHRQRLVVTLFIFTEDAATSAGDDAWSEPFVERYTFDRNGVAEDMEDAEVSRRTASNGE